MSKKTKKMMSMLLVVTLIAVTAVGGMLAYLTSEDSDVNVMTLGEVKIEQIEQQRGADGTLEEFENDKPLFPAVYDNYAWDEDLLEVNGTGYEVFDDAMKNVQDKIVTVKNKGKSDAYVRTVIAFESPESFDDSLLHLNCYTDDKAQGQWLYIMVDGTRYVVTTFTYNDAIPAGATSSPSLLQVFLNKATTNENIAGLGDTYEILVLSQAAQTNGFANATAALDAGFGEFNEANATEWFNGVINENSADTWDGTADTSWYNEEDTEFGIRTAEELAGFAVLVDEGNTFAGKTVKLLNDIDLGLLDANGDPVSFDPIGDKSAFEGTFEGNNHKIENLYQSGWAFGYEWGKYGSIGLFGNLESATIKNLTISNAEAQIEGGDVGGITGSATGDCVFENITIEGTKLGTYNNGLGGIIGWSGAGNYTFKNVTIDKNTVLAGLWGSFDSSIGGVVGQGEPGATYNFENVDIACRLDVYNDCTASYDYYNYRMCGMIIGRLQKTTTIDGVNYPDTSKYNITCNDVTVTYGEWMNYHYCEPTPGHNGGRGMRVEPGYAYGGLPADFDHSQCVDNHMTLIPFDQIFGGDQYGVKGLKAYTGVTVNYPN